MNPDGGIEQVRVATFDNEPLARLSQQRLQEEGIPCVLKSLGAGSGAWGGNSFVPHGLYVFSRDREKALGVINGTDSPEYPVDSSAVVEGTVDMDVREVREDRGQGVGGFLLTAVIIVLVVTALSAIYTSLR
jgi:hypothetical protein